MVITVQIIKLTNEPTFSRLRFCPLSPSGRMRASRAIAWQTSAMTAEIIAMRRQPPFLQQTGNNQRKTDGVGDKREQSKNGHSDVDSLSNKKEKQYSVR